MKWSGLNIMHRILLLALLGMIQLVATPVLAQITPPKATLVIGQSVAFQWDPNVESTLAGYKVYVGAASGQYGPPVDVKNVTTWTLGNLTAGTYYVAVTAYDTNGNESGFSNEVVATILATSPRVEFVGVMNITTTTAYVAWTTQPECSGSVQIGTTNALGRAVAANNLATTDHAVIIGSLVTRTHYFYKVVSVCNGVTVQSGIRSFNTK